MDNESSAAGGTTNSVAGNENVIIQSGSHTGDVIVHPPERKAVVPRQLPASTRHFVGRARELARLTGVLDAAAGTVVITAVDGTAGIGKTALALHWAHQIKHRFPDGQLYVDLGGFAGTGGPVPADVAVRIFLDALDVASDRIPVDLDGQAALFRSVVAQRRLLIMLDNARDATQVQPLLPGGDRCLVIVTSRSQLSPLMLEYGAECVTLELLDSPQATALLAALVDAERLAAEAEAVAELVAICARLPLALAIAAARIAGRPRHSLRAMVADLRAERTRLDRFMLGGPDISLRAVFEWSYRALTAPTARLFRLIGLHPGLDIGLPAVAALAAVPTEVATAMTDELVRLNLIEEHVDDRFRTHDLLRVYAAERATAQESADDRRAALARVFDFYLHTTIAADRWIHPSREPIVPAAPDDRVTPLEFADHKAAMDWFTAEDACLIRLADHAAGAGFDVIAWQLPWAMHTVMNREVAVLEAAVRATVRLGDRWAEARMRDNLGHTYAHHERCTEALAEVERAGALFAELGMPGRVAHTTHSLSWMLARQFRYVEGLACAERAFALQRELGDRFGTAEALNTIGWLAGLLGDHQRDLDCRLTALAIFRELGQAQHVAFALSGIGTVYHRLGRHTEALGPQAQAVALMRERGEDYEEGVALLSLGQIQLALDNRAAAESAWRRAEALFDRVKHSKVAEARSRLAELPPSD